MCPGMVMGDMVTLMETRRKMMEMRQWTAVQQSRDSDNAQNQKTPKLK